MKHFSDLKTGDLFHIEGHGDYVYEHRGNGWYGGFHGYDGGPWRMDGNPRVFLLEAAHEEHLRLMKA